MIYWNKYKVMLLFAMLTILAFPTHGWAESSSSLPSAMIIGDDQGLKVTSSGDYLVDIRNVEPGKKWIRKITLSNMEKNSSYLLTMSIKKPTKIEGKLDLSTAIQMIMYYHDEVVYRGPISGVGPTRNLQDISKPLDLGIFTSGETGMLEVHFEIDGEKYTNGDFFEKNTVENIWHFKAVKASNPDGKPAWLLPSTGEEWSQVLIAFCLVLFLLLIMLLIIKHKWGKKE